VRRVRQLVLTIHGVTPDRGWQSRAARVLEPHFQCEPISYWQYGSFLGALAVVFNLSTIVALIALVVAGRFRHLHNMYTFVLCLLAVIVAGMTLSIAMARYRRRRVIDRVKVQISEKATQASAHIIAHSFGTYIVGWALKKFQDLRFGRVVLVGCVLPPVFDWISMRRGPIHAFDEIRNDVGLSDPVVRLVKWLGRLVPDLGAAGLSGFIGEPTLVHSVDEPWGPCPDCLQSSPRPLVHNVFLDKYRHSDWALGPGHVRELWLPFLWGLSPREFNEFVQCCCDAAYARQEEFWQDLELAEQRLAEHTWSWTRDRRLKDFIAAELDEKIRRSAPEIGEELRDNRTGIIDDAFTLTYLAIAEALEESADIKSELTDERANVILALYPKRGIARALQLATDTRTHS
jgi:pimeloyl-ACP methyl ester carboxylesterase